VIAQLAGAALVVAVMLTALYRALDVRTAPAPAPAAGLVGGGSGVASTPG
jgi:hypothetical protein